MIKTKRCFFFGSLILLLTIATLVAQTPPPATEIFLVELTRRGGQLSLGQPRNITRRDGYDNQPSFHPNGQSLFYTSIREDKQADIYRYDLGSGTTTRVTETAESEYSPTVMPAGKSFSVIRVEADTTQRLWQFPLSGGPPSLVLKQIKPVGYHVWLDNQTLALFVLGTPNTLQLVDARTEKAEVLVGNIGRSLHKISGQAKLSFVHKVAEQGWMIKEFDLKTRQMKPLIKTLPGSEDFVWLPDGTMLMAQGTKLFKWQSGQAQTWQEITDFAAAGLNGITRLAVSPKGDKLALVASQSAASTK